MSQMTDKYKTIDLNVDYRNNIFITTYAYYANKII